MDKKKRPFVLGDDGEISGEILSVPEKPKRSGGSPIWRTGCIVLTILLALLLGIVIGVVTTSREQAVSVPAPGVQTVSQPTLTPLPISTLNRTHVAPTETPIPPRTGISHILWISDCDPRTDTKQCSLGKLDILNEFYATIRDLGADIKYRLPRSSGDMASYDVVVLSTCDLAGSALPVSLVQDYVSTGGSLIIMGDNFCQGVHVNGKWGSSADAASLFTASWGIRFTADDAMDTPTWTAFAEHPLTVGIKDIYAFRHAYLTVQPPAVPIATINRQAVLAVYDGPGTVLAIPDVSFAWGSSFKSQIGSADNFAFWRNSFVWLSQQSRAKRG